MKPPWTKRIFTIFLLVSIVLLCDANALEHSTPVRLVGSNVNTAGRLEVYHNGIWGTVCDDGANAAIAEVVCKQLGYSSNVVYIKSNAYFGAGTGQIWMDNVRCTGAEISLDKCGFNGWGSHNCGHHEDLSVICTVGYVSGVYPNSGSLQGGTTVTIEGKGFSSNNFNHFPGTEHLGNKVYLINDHEPFPCEVIIQKTSTSKIVCVTSSMPQGSYTVQVSVDGADIPTPSNLRFQTNSYNTPTISKITPTSGPPGTILALKGQIFTSKYGINDSTNGRNEEIARVMAGGDMCDLKSPDGKTYGIVLDNDGRSTNGFMACKLSERGSKLGNINASFTLSPMGKSQANLDLYRVSRNGQIFMFQSYAEIESIFPQSGSTEGGTVITITGRFFDETKSKAVVKVQGADCHVIHVSDTTVICRTTRQPTTQRELHPGNRGIIVESWNETFADGNDLKKIKTLNESFPDYQVTFADAINIPGGPNTKPYVNRMRGFFMPPFDGEYQLVLTSNAGAQLYLSTDEDSANLRLLANRDTRGTQTTTKLLLQSNQSYYMEVFYRQSTSAVTVNVAARYLDSIVNHYMAGNVQQEQQEIRLTSANLKEKQTITIPYISNQTAIYEEQEIIVKDLDEPGRLRLGMYSVFTESISVGASDIDMMNALQALPVFDVSETVLVNRTVYDQGFKYTITFVSERGNFPLLDWKRLSGTFSLMINTTRDGKPSGSKVGLMMAGIPAPLIDSNTSHSQVSDALEDLFTVRCPTYWINPKGKAIHHTMEESASLPSYMRSYRTNKYQAFCGSWVLLKPNWLHDSTGSYSQEIYLTFNPFFCVAVKGTVSRIYMYFTYTDGNGKIITTSYNSYDLIITIGTEEWNYGCYNLRNSITTIYPDATNIILRRLRLYYSSDALVDEVYFGQQATTSDTDYISMRRLGCFPNGYKIPGVNVATYGMSYDVTLTPEDGGHGFPLFTVDVTQLPPDANISVVRKVAASPPLSGTFDLTLRGQTLSSIPVGLGPSDMEAVLQGFENIGVIKSTSSYYDLYHKLWRFRFDTHPGNVEQIQINASSVFGVNLESYVTTITDGEYRIDPLYGEMLQTAHDKTQVNVVINDVPSKCTGSCIFEWLPSSTPVVNNASRVQGPPYTTIQIHGTGFSETASNNNVTIGGLVCNVTMATDTLITCDIDDVPGGEHAVVVDVQGSGLAKYGDGNATVFFSMQVDGINPTKGGLGGSVELTIVGTGFSENSSVEVGDKICKKLFVNTTNIICLIPSTNAAGTVPVIVDQIGEIPVTADQFTYEDTITPRVTSLSPTSTGVSDGERLLITGDGFDAGGNVTLFVAGTETNITFNNNSYITAELPPCSPGVHDVKIIVGDNGAALTSENKLPSISCTLLLASVNPVVGSVFGGTRLTLTGAGFTPRVKVKVGTKNCKVQKWTDNQIICQLERIRTVHRVNNNGNHPNFGKYYYWNPQHVEIMVGDIVRWDWDFPFYITTMKPKIEETFNMTTKYGKPGGFSSGGAGTSTGFYSHEFSKAGTFYYWSGLIDQYGTTWFHGSVEVKERTSYLTDVTVTVAGFEAIYEMKNTTTTLDFGTCSDTTSSRANCSDPFPVEPTDMTTFNFAFWTCVSPVVYKISRQNGTTNDEVLISGDGFSSSGCANNVSFGDYICNVSSSSASSLICNIDPENKPQIGRPQYLDVLVDNLGYAHFNENENILKTFALFPLVNQIFPVNGSRGGHTRITISGTGFGDGNRSNTTEVTVGGYPCSVISSSYTEIVCFTPRSNSGQRQVSVFVETDLNLRIPAECDTTCYFTYDIAMTPTVTDISPTSITGENSTTITIFGTGFEDETQNVYVTMTATEKHPCLVANVSYSQIVCMLTNLPVGDNLVEVDISGKGRALHPNGDVKLVSMATISSISPAEGSKYGGTDVTVTGNGFLSDVRVHINGSPCTVKYTTLMSVVFTTEVHPIGRKVVTIWSNGNTYPHQYFDFTDDASPRITDIHPASGKSGENITITGYNLGRTFNQTHVFIGDSICNIIAVEDTEINCTVGNIRAGAYFVYVNVKDFGNSNSDKTFIINMSADDITPSSGSLAGGQTVTIHGTGFDDDMEVTICGRVCNKSQSDKTEPTEHVCITPPPLGSAILNCTVHVTVNNVTEKLTDAYTYDPTKTPVIDDVTPKRGGTQGGTRITISGSNFGSAQVINVDCTSTVTISGTLCNITSWSNTQVVCVTEAHSRSERAFVRLETGCNGKADETKAGFHFVDVWSSVYTWGGAELGLPTAGDIVVIQKGQTIMFDTHTPVLKMLVIQGGELVFDETDVELQAENILITDGGLLQVGTEDDPFQHKATITLHGHHRSKELPIYGTKAIIVREGMLDLHGAHIPMTWTKLSQSAANGDTQIQLQHQVTWREGDQIIIATTGGPDSQSESEVSVIASVAADNKTIILNAPLTYPHLGNDGSNGYQLSAEVALLTRNVVIRGHSDLQWIEEIKACPDGFDSDYFATQTCAQGRYGDEMGSDQFGAQVIIHTTDPTKPLTNSRIEFVEFRHVGQAFRLGRHPISFHGTGDVSRSYVRGCGIHGTFNRAINIKDTHNLLVERNVIYNVNGAAIVLEDGTETGNVFQYNLGVFVKGSSQLLNDDISAATFWITNPNNTFRHNVAAGGTHFGYWFQLENSVSSPVTGTHLPIYTPLAEFNNNTAHSLGMFGLWIRSRYTPHVMNSFNSYSSSRKAAVIDNMYVWNCRAGIVLEEMGAVQVKRLTAINNIEVGYEGKEIIEGNQYTDDSPLLEDSLIVGHDKDTASDECTKKGIASPYKFGFTIRNVSFTNFDKPDCSALTITRIPERCDSLCGGYMYRTENLTFTDVDIRVNNDWIWESVYEDMDGSLCGSPSCKVVPCTGTLPSHCTTFSNSSNIPLCTCPSDVKLFRFAVSSSSYTSSWPVVFSNAYGSTRHQYRQRAIDPSRGWMTNFVAGESYLWNFNNRVPTNFSCDGIAYRLQYGDYVIINQELTGEPDEFRIDGYNLIPATNETLDPEIHYHGDWQYNETSDMIKYLISYRRKGSTGDTGVRDVTVRLRIKKCFFKGCVNPPTLPPTPAPTTPQPLPPSTAGCVYWSSPTSWPNSRLPTDGDDVTISKGVCMIADTLIPRINKLVIYGLLEFDHGPVNDSYREFTLSVTDIIVIGGNLLAGSPNDPFLGKIDIILRGQRPGYSDTVEYLPSTHIPVNSKTIAIYGGLELHGKDVGVAWTRLAIAGNPGDTSITVADNVTWKVGEKIVITPTSYNIWETEIFKIMDVSDDGFNLTLNDSLQFRHIAHEETISGKKVILSAKVGLLTRNIRVLGEDENAMHRDNYGGRVVVGATMAGGAYHSGFARFSNVEFYHTGQLTPFSDKRYSLGYINAGTVTAGRPSSVIKCVFHHGFSAAIGVSGTNGLALTDNVIHHAVSTGIETQAFRTTIQRNLVTLVKDSGSYSGAISGIGSRELILKDNTVSGTSGVAFRVPGVECGDTSGPTGNEAHSSSIGLAVFPQDSVQGSCLQISNYFIWKCNNIGVYYNNRLSVVLNNNILAENMLGLYSQVIGPSAVNHLFSPKYCTVKHSLIIGTTSSFNCTSDKATSTSASDQVTGGHVGLTFTSFMGGSNGAPVYDLTGIRTYPAIMGVTNVQGVTFAHFKTVCGHKDVMLTTNRGNDDGQHPVVTRGITKYDSESDNFFFIHRPNIEKINPSDCVDMDCDGLKKALIKDEDGSFLGTKGGVVSESEWEWDGDPRRGLGDYRIPREMLTTLTGERINVSSIAPQKGIIRNDQCQYRDTWQAYECHNRDYGMLIIESLDEDTETRRLSPVAILGDGYLDLINGPQDHSGCSQGNCRKRLSTFMSIVASGVPYILHFTTTSPQTLRFFLLNSNDNQVVTLGIWFSQSNRRDVYVNDELVQAKNARMVNGKYVVDPPTVNGEFVPDVSSSDVTGTNFFDRDSNILYVLVRGSTPVKIVTNPSFIVSFQIPALTPKEFYKGALIHNLALFFDVPPEKVRVVNVVRESGRRRRDADDSMEIKFEIGDSPTEIGNATINETMTTESLLNKSSKFINEVQGGGDISQALNISVRGIAISEPLPKVRKDRNINTENSAGKLTVPKSMRIVMEPTMSYERLPFPTQPCLKVFDVQDDSMAKVGGAADPWRVTAYLILDTNKTAKLLGNTTVDIVAGWANFTDLRISHYGGNFSIQFNKTYPENEIMLINETKYFPVHKLDISLRINVSEDKIIINNATEMKIELINMTTKQQINDLDRMGPGWIAAVHLSNVSEPPGNMTGSRSVTFDPSTGEAMFDNLTFDQIGTYILIFTVTASTADYVIYGNVTVQVLNQKQFELLDSNTTSVSNISLTFNENFHEVVGNKADEFGAYVINILSLEYPNVLFVFVTVREGSILTELTAHTSPADMNDTLVSISNTVESNNFTFNEINLRSPILRVIEKPQNNDTLLPTTGHTSSTSESPTSTSETPTSTSETPTSTSETPTSTSENPTSTSETPTSTSETPTSTTETPTSTSETPTSTSESPTSASETPTSASETPTSTSETPTSTSETPTSTSESPTSTSETPTSTSETPTSTSETPTSTSESPTSTSETPTSTSESPTSTSETPTSTSETPISASESPTSGSETPTSTSESPSSTSETPTSTSETPTSTSETPTSTSEMSTSTSGTTTPHMVTPTSTLESSTQTLDTTVSTYSSDAGLSVPMVIAIVITPLAIFLGVMFIVIFFKYRKSKKQEITERLTRTSTASSDEFIPRKDKTTNEYTYQSPFSIRADMKPHHHQISHLHSTLALKLSTPTYEIQNQLPSSSVGRFGSADGHHRRPYQGSGRDDGYSSNSYNSGKRQ